ncbi:hypothetical protein K443DRAFT_112285, partial [Laccaria amethystina LaAM-08-1]
WTLTGPSIHWTRTGLDWTGNFTSQSGLARGPLESIWITWSRVKTSMCCWTINLPPLLC